MNAEVQHNRARYKIFKYLASNGDAVMFGSVTQRYIDNWPEGTGLEIIEIPEEYLSGPGTPENPTQEGEASPDEFFVDITLDPPVVTPCPDMGLSIDKTEINADGVDYVEISGFPPESRIHLPDGTTVVENDDGIFQWSTTAPGDFLIYWTHYKFLNGEVVIRAN